MTGQAAIVTASVDKPNFSPEIIPNLQLVLNNRSDRPCAIFFVHLAPRPPANSLFVNVGLLAIGPEGRAIVAGQRTVVAVIAISPGPIADTEGMARLAPDPATRQAHYDRIAMKRWGTTYEIAEAAVFLSSDAAHYITGTVLDVDGGSQIGDASRMNTATGLT